MNYSILQKTMENVRNHGDIKLVTSDKRRKILVSEPNYYFHKKFSDHLMAIEMKMTRVKMTKRLYLGMPILYISKILMYKFGMIILGQSIGTRKNCARQILIALLYTLKPKIFLKIFLMILRNGLIRIIIIKMIKHLF